MTETPQDALPQRDADSRGGSGRLVRWFSVLFFLFAALGVYVFVQHRSDRRVLAEQTEQLAVLHVATVHAMPLAEESELVLPGNIQPYVDSPIYARTNGYLKKWYRDIGSRVREGELLADIDTPEVDAQLAQARADLATAQANVKLAGITADRYQELLKSDAVSKQEVDNYAGDYAAKQAMVQSAQANLKRLEEMESFKHVYAPFSGVITQRNVDPGTLINAGAGSRPMFDLAQTDPLRVYISVPQAYAPAMRTGVKACLELSEFPGRNFCGHVVRTAGAVEPTTRTLLTEVDVPNTTGTLLQGEYSQVHFDLESSGTHISVPINALLFRPEGTLVATVDSKSRLLLKKLSIGRDLGNSVEVLGGVNLDDAIVINPPDSLESGQHVVVTPDSSTTVPK